MDDRMMNQIKKFKKVVLNILAVTIILQMLTTVTAVNKPHFSNVAIFLIDAARSEQTVYSLETNPNNLLNNTVYFQNTTTVFPASSPAAHTSIFTGGGSSD